MPDRQPPVFGRYECLVPLGRGGMAEVWVARARGARGFEKLLAIKTMLPAMLDDPGAEAMFLDEARLAARIRHPNVTEIFDLGEEAGQLFIAMDWIDGDSASGLARALDAPLPLPLALHIAIEAGKGLHAAHELLGDDGQAMGLVHRDVSPHNVLLSRTGLVVLSDFGIAKALGHTSRTDTGVVKGKPGYMAPEQAMGASVDRRADVFALGVVLYELCTRKHPFRGSNAIETAERLLRQPFAPPSSHVASLPRELDAVIMRALERDPVARFASAEELGLELARVARGRAGEASASQLGEYLQVHLGARFALRDAALRSAMSGSAPRELRSSPASEQLAVTARGVPVPDGQAKGVAVTQVSLSRALPVSEPVSPRSKLVALAGVLMLAIAAASYWWRNGGGSAQAELPTPPGAPSASGASASQSLAAPAVSSPKPPLSASPTEPPVPTPSARSVARAPKSTSVSRPKPGATPDRPSSGRASPSNVPVRDPGF